MYRDLVVAEIELPAIGADWKDAIRRRAISAHEVLVRHPWAALLVGSYLNVGIAMRRYVDATLGCLREAGFSWEIADPAWNAIDSHVCCFTVQQLDFPLEKSEYASAAKQFLPLIPESEFPYMRALTAGTHEGVHDFRFGLELILDGLERRLASARDKDNRR